MVRTLILTTVWLSLVLLGAAMQAPEDQSIEAKGSDRSMHISPNGLMRRAKSSGPAASGEARSLLEAEDNAASHIYVKRTQTVQQQQQSPAPAPTPAPPATSSSSSPASGPSYGKNENKKETGNNDDSVQPDNYSSETIAGEDKTADTDKGKWRDKSSFYYNSLADCSARCSKSSNCKSFVDNKNPGAGKLKYCVFKKTATLADDSDKKKDAYVKFTASSHSWTKTAGKKVGGSGSDDTATKTACCAWEATGTAAGTWKDNKSFQYSNIDECKSRCSASSTCKSFVDNKKASPKFCRFKTSTTSEDSSDKDMYVKGDAASTGSSSSSSSSAGSSSAGSSSAGSSSGTSSGTSSGSSSAGSSGSADSSR